MLNFFNLITKTSICSFLFFILISNSALYAHRVIVFAWVEGDTVYTQSKFSGGKKAKNALVEVYDDSGTKLLQGRTDSEGEFSFIVPRKTTMKIVLKAGMGHQGDWTIPLEELEDAALNPDEKTEEIPPMQNQPQKEADRNIERTVELSDREFIQQVIEKSLDEKLKPVVNKLNKLSEPDTTPSLTDILAGIGYIIGLVGLATYVHYRRKLKDSDS